MADVPFSFDPRTALHENVVLQGSRLPHYGSSEGGLLKQQAPIAQGLTARRWLDWQSLAFALALPLGLFLATFCSMSFKFNYQSPTSALLLVASAFFFVLMMAFLSTHQIRKWKNTGVRTWHLFVIITSFLAVLLGSVLGYCNFKSNASRYYDYISLRRIADVEPGQWQGGQALDAGELDFRAGTKVNTQMNMVYFQKKGWCAAPIVASDGAPLASYDFWAVGVDCCSSRHGDFACGSTGQNGEPLLGLRVLDDSEIAGYKLAVMQAQAAYNIQVHNPIFLLAVKSPYALIKSYWNHAITFAYTCMSLFALFQVAAVCTQAYIFGKDAEKFYTSRV
mmetsp:Transcript_116882/g.183825  ORF Transcript_116882/g.183825 Transcript_116882/m.183825 type:complete len:336 (-) Transcript_116882:57-1064(-)